jgi:AraC-like DNA-binding protein
MAIAVTIVWLMYTPATAGKIRPRPGVLARAVSVVITCGEAHGFLWEKIKRIGIILFIACPIAGIEEKLALSRKNIQEGSATMPPVCQSTARHNGWGAFAASPPWLRIDRPDEGITLISGQNRRLQEDLMVCGPCAPMFCIGILLDGAVRMTLDGAVPLELRAGMAVLQSSPEPTSGQDIVRASLPFRLVDIRFTPEYLHRLCGCALPGLDAGLVTNCSLPERQIFLGSIAAPQPLLRIAQDILSLECNHSGIRAMYLRAKAMEALAVVLSGVLKAPRAAYAVPGCDRSRLLAARHLLDEHYAETWTVRQLSAQAGLNEKRMQAGFQALFGVTVHAYLTRTRIEAAATLLAEGTTVTETAYAVGFSSLSHFSKVYRSVMGVRPKAWSTKPSGKAADKMI